MFFPERHSFLQNFCRISVCDDDKGQTGKHIWLEPTTPTITSAQLSASKCLWIICVNGGTACCKAGNYNLCQAWAVEFWMMCVAVYYQYGFQVGKHHWKLLMQPWLIPPLTFPWLWSQIWFSVHSCSPGRKSERSTSVWTWAQTRSRPHADAQLCIVSELDARSEKPAHLHWQDDTFPPRTRTLLAGGGAGEAGQTCSGLISSLLQFFIRNISPVPLSSAAFPLRAASILYTSITNSCHLSPDRKYRKFQKHTFTYLIIHFLCVS